MASALAFAVSASSGPQARSPHRAIHWPGTRPISQAIALRYRGGQLQKPYGRNVGHLAVGEFPVTSLTFSNRTAEEALGRVSFWLLNALFPMSCESRKIGLGISVNLPITRPPPLRVTLGDQRQKVRVYFVLRPSGGFAGIDGLRKLARFDLAVDGWFGVFDAPGSEIIPTKEPDRLLPVHFDSIHFVLTCRTIAAHKD